MRSEIYYTPPISASTLLYSFVCSAFRDSKNKNPLLILAIYTSLASCHDENNWRQHMTSTLVVKNVFIVAFNSIYLFGSLHACKVPLAQLFSSIVFMCMQMGSLVLKVLLVKINLNMEQGHWIKSFGNYMSLSFICLVFVVVVKEKKYL